MNILTKMIGYPCINKGRKEIKALESFWRGKSTEEFRFPLVSITEQLATQLKTRHWEEVIPALNNTVETTKKLQEGINDTQK